jgi:hypothetical protein
MRPLLSTLLVLVAAACAPVAGGAAHGAVRVPGSSVCCGCDCDGPGTRARTRATSLVPLRGGALGRVPPSASPECRALNLQLWQASRMGPCSSACSAFSRAPPHQCASLRLLHRLALLHPIQWPVPDQINPERIIRAGRAELLEAVVQQGAQVNAAFETADDNTARRLPCLLIGAPACART